MANLSTDYNPSFKMLLLGETGSGKTSLINLFYNYALIENLGNDETKLNEVKAYNDINLEDLQSSSMETKTTGTKEYCTTLNELEIGIIDTPGFGDTRGFEKDHENIEKIKRILEDTEHINCVCLVMNGRTARLTSFIKYILTEITTVLPKQILNNVIVMFTNTDAKFDLNCNVEDLLKCDCFDLCDKITADKIFYIDNPCCKLLKAKEMLSDKATFQNLARLFNATAEKLQIMHEAIKNFKAVDTIHFVNLYETKLVIEEKVLNILKESDKEADFDKQIRVQQEELNQKNSFPNYEIIQQKFRNVIMEKTEKPNTICTVKSCFSNCHEPCLLDRWQGIHNCKCIGKDEKCTVCGHHYKVHCHTEFKYIIEECEEHLEVKDYFEKLACMEDKSTQGLMQQLEERRKESQKAKEKLSTELRTVLGKFHAKSMNRNYAKVLQTQIDIIKPRLEDPGESHKDSLQNIIKELEMQLTLIEKTLNA